MHGCGCRENCQGGVCCGTIRWWPLEWRARCQALRHLCVLSCRAPPVPEAYNFLRQIDFFMCAAFGSFEKFFIDDKLVISILETCNRSLA